ncbi:MAG: glycosyltransferase [Candidatus Aminicenantales bacterium]
MKIIHVSYQPELYGIGTFLFNLVEYQKNADENLEVSVVFHADGPQIEEYKKLGIPVYCLRDKTAHDASAVFRLSRIFKDYHLVHLHTYSPWAALAAKISKTRLVYTFHGTLGLRNKALRDFFIRLIHRWLVNRFCEKIIFASRASLIRYLDGIGCRFDKKKMEIFPYGLQLRKIYLTHSRAEIRKYLEINGKFTVGTAARIDPVKRIEYLIEAFSYLPHKDNFKLLIMGSGEKEYEEYLRAEVKKNSLDHQVLFMGYRKDALDIISSLDLFVLPTRNEAFGMALLEAMALGIPCAVFKDGGGAVEILGDKGFIVENSKELSEIILKLKNSPLARKSAARKIKERAQNFDIKFCAENLWQIYNLVMDRS